VSFRCALAVAAALTPSALAAEHWTEVARLTGDVPVEFDEDSVSEAMDGATTVLLATFRRQMPAGVMESDVAIDCVGEKIKLRGVRLISEGGVYQQQVGPTELHSISYGSADALYFKALCGWEPAIPPEVQAQIEQEAREAAERAEAEAAAREAAEAAEDAAAGDGTHIQPDADFDAEAEVEIHGLDVNDAAADIEAPPPGGDNVIPLEEIPLDDVPPLEEVEAK